MSAVLNVPRGAMDHGHRVLAIVSDRMSVDLLRQALDEAHIAGCELIQGSVDAATSRLGTSTEPEILLFDLSNSVTPVEDLKHVAAAASPDLKIIALGAQNDVQLYRELTEAGAADYLVKPIRANTLEAAFTRITRTLHHTAPTASRLGKLAIFTGTRGGVGTTTCAINAAWLLAHQSGQRTALVDLDLHFGTVALGLDIDPGRGLRETLEQPSRIDGLFIDRTAVRIGERLFILSAEEAVDDHAEIAPGAIDILLHELREKFSWVIVDLPRSHVATAASSIAIASHLVIVAEPSLAGLRDAVRIDSLIKSSGSAAKRLIIDGGAGRAPRSQIDRAEFEKSLGHKVDLTVPFDPKAASMSANGGRALVDIAENAPAAKAMHDLVGLLAGPTTTDKKPTLWQRMMGK